MILQDSGWWSTVGCEEDLWGCFFSYSPPIGLARVLKVVLKKQLSLRQRKGGKICVHHDTHPPHGLPDEWKGILVTKRIAPWHPSLSRVSARWCGQCSTTPRTSHASSGLTSRWAEHAHYLIYRLGCMSSARIFNVTIFRTGLEWETLNADSVRPSLPYDLVTLGWAWKSLVCNMNHFGVIKNLNYKLVWFRRRNTCYEVSVETLTFIDTLRSWEHGIQVFSLERREIWNNQIRSKPIGRFWELTRKRPPRAEYGLGMNWVRIRNGLSTD